MKIINIIILVALCAILIAECDAQSKRFRRKAKNSRVKKVAANRSAVKKTGRNTSVAKNVGAKKTQVKQTSAKKASANKLTAKKPVAKKPAASGTEAKIIGGTTTTIDTMNYVVNLRKDGTFICTGSLVKPQYVVSAAHCVKGVAASRLKVHAGSTYLDSGGVSRQVIKTTIPKSFTMTKMQNDVSILKLESELTGTNIGTINLCTTSLKAGTIVRVSGWGLTSTSSSTASNQLRTTQLRLFNKKQCIRRYRGRETLTKSMICARWTGRDTCSGDSGGPMVVNGELCGITSWGISCAVNAYPGIYTNVNVVKNFINNNMK
ncbi:trypsin beta-like [Teleopsis dalmanni]|uniref:trypsin beta-like n=1 Tax=Teleopsis dalmanni TaxID=139649 RepID=UPI0018CE2D49|nr:trypsin beta-like [Teleopsis dalmanni]